MNPTGPRLNIEEKAPKAEAAWLTLTKKLLPVPLAVVFFFVVCLCSKSTVKATTMTLIVTALFLTIVFFSRLRERMSWPVIALLLFTVMNGISTLYAVAPKFALYEFLKIIASFCMALILLVIAPKKGADAGRWIASILEGFATIASLVSIDMIATHRISDPVIEFLERFSGDFSALVPLNAGERINSIFHNPNVFAGVTGIGVMLSLGLVMSSEKKPERCIHIICLCTTSLAFILAFSMGASGIIVLAFIVYLIMESRERRFELLILMAETLVFALISAVLISKLSFTAWEEPRYVPLMCLAVGAAGICLLECFVSHHISNALKGHGRVVLVFFGVALAAVIGYAIAAVNVIGSVNLEPGESLRRSVYPEPGEYTLMVTATEPVNVSLYSESRQETILNTHTRIFSGMSEAVSFTVPEDSWVVYIYVQAGDKSSTVESITYEGDSGSGKVPLWYKLLPGFVANRLQGIFANQSTITRWAYFSDGMKLFTRHPMLGYGLGGFENSVKRVQSFYYETRYVHNHYIQTLIDTGVAGCVLFVVTILSCAVCLWLAWFKKAFNPMVPAMWGGLVFMAGHAAAEVDFSVYAYIPMAFSFIALIGLETQRDVPQLKKEKFVQISAVAGYSALTLIFAVLLYNNMRAARLTEEHPTLYNLVKAVELDKYEWADYALSYVIYSTEHTEDSHALAQSDVYAERLAKENSNTIPYYLSDFYFTTDRTEEALEMAEKYLTYTASDSGTWQKTFDLLEKNEKSTRAFKECVTRLADRMDEWNEENIGEITLNAQSLAFIERVRGAT